MKKESIIRKIYLYSFSLLGLVLVVIGAVRLVTLGLKVYIFTKADINYIYPAPKVVPAEDGKVREVAEPSQEEISKYNEEQAASQRQRDAAESLAMLIVGVPLYVYHWNVTKRERVKNADESIA